VNQQPRFFQAVAVLLGGALVNGSYKNFAQEDGPTTEKIESSCLPKYSNASAMRVHCEGTVVKPPTSQWSDTASAGIKETQHSIESSKLFSSPSLGRRPRNVMIHRMRSVRARDMGDKYNICWHKVLGEGAYGSVHPARLAATGEKVALKKISKRFTNNSNFKTETDALLRIYDNGGHPNISGLRDMYEDYSHFYLILDLVSGGEMFDHLISYGAYCEADAARLMREVASALAFIHGVGVVHADLKPENLLLCSKKVADGTIKLIDFGCAVVENDNFHDDDDINASYDDEEMRPKSVSGPAPLTGTTAYWPQERFVKGTEATPAMDMWSVGIILYIMLVGAHPFDLGGKSSDTEIEERIKTNPSPPIGGPYTSHLSPSAIDLIQKLMERDPSKRLTAYGMMQHPWIRGETASTSKITDSGKKLSRFKYLRSQLEAGIFAVLVSNANQDETLSEVKVRDKETACVGSSASHIMKRAFEVFDNEGKGFVSADDLGRVVSEVAGLELSSNDKTDMLAATLEGNEDAAGITPGLSLSVFSELFGTLKHAHFQKGEMVFNAHDEGDAMYFITSGKAEVLTRKGQLISILRHGDFFGEGSLLEENNRRFTSIRAATPLDVIMVSREDFERYISSSSRAKQSLKLKWKARTLADAKNLIRLQTNVKTRNLKRGDVVYKEGEVGASMFLVDEKDGGTFDVKHGDAKVHTYHGGDSFGESSLLMKKPRWSTVICTSETCKIHEMLGDDFLAVVESSPELAASLRNMCRKRMFKKAVKLTIIQKKRGFTQEDIEAAFHDADSDKSGRLSLSEVRALFHNVDPNFPEEEIVALLKFLDVDEDGYLNLDEFKRIFRCFEDSRYEVQKQDVF